MTREEIMNLPAGAEMNTLVFERVFGMRLEKNHGFAGGSYWVGNGITFGERMKHDVPEYSTDIAAAWEVVDKMPSGYELRLHEHKLINHSWQAEFHEPGTENFMVLANTAPLAICRAALLALLNI